MSPSHEKPVSQIDTSRPQGRVRMGLDVKTATPEQCDAAIKILFGGQVRGSVVGARLLGGSTTRVAVYAYSQISDPNGVLSHQFGRVLGMIEANASKASDASFFENKCVFKDTQALARAINRLAAWKDKEYGHGTMLRRISEIGQESALAV